MGCGSGCGPAAGDDDDDAVAERPVAASGGRTGAPGDGPGAGGAAGPDPAGRRARRVLAADRRWPGQARAAAGSALLVLAALLGLDQLSGTLTPLRTGCWLAVAGCQLSVLHPPLVTAGEGWLASRGLFRERLVRTDLLASVSGLGGMAPRLVLRDVLGHRVELDPEVLTANPLLWHELDRGVRLSRRRGLLRCGAATLAALGARVDGEGARGLLRAAGLPDPD